MSNEVPVANIASEIDIIKDALSKISDSNAKRAIKKFIGAAMGGIPWCLGLATCCKHCGKFTMGRVGKVQRTYSSMA